MWLAACGSDGERSRSDAVVEPTTEVSPADVDREIGGDSGVLDSADVERDDTDDVVAREVTRDGVGDVLDDGDSEVEDLVEDVLADTAVSTDASDAAQDLTEADAGCIEGEACTFAGYLPPCYQGRCSHSGRCVGVRVEGCCRDDDDCPPADDGACASVHCLQQVCTTLTIPGCCQASDESACDDGLPATSDACIEPAARCANCEPPCESRPVLWRASFDEATATPASEGMIVYDPQANDGVTWQRTGEHFAAGGGAVYLGNARCRSYYGGALDAACTPVDPAEQDSERVLVGLYTATVFLPADRPAVLTAWVRASVEPLGHFGAGEPDVLRIWVQPLGVIAPIWPVGSTLDVGKSTGWVPIAVDLSPWRGGYVRVRFEFDTLDGESNHHEGVWLDEIVIREACTDGGCCEDDSDCGSSEPGACSRRACLVTLQGGARICADIARTPGELCTPCADDAQCADDDPCTDDTCRPTGRCGHEVFCCLERALLAEPFTTSLGAMTVVDPDPTDGVRWQLREQSAWFGDPSSGTYGASGPVSGDLLTPEVALPIGLKARQSVALTLALRLSTEWDAQDQGALEPLDNPAGLDRLSVAVIDGELTTEVWSSDQIGGTTGGATHLLELDLMPWRGRTIRVRIRFDSGDETLNGFAGPFVDDLTLGIRCDL